MNEKFLNSIKNTADALAAGVHVSVAEYFLKLEGYSPDHVKEILNYSLEYKNGNISCDALEAKISNLSLI